MSGYDDTPEQVITNLEGYYGTIDGYWIISNKALYFVRELEDENAVTKIAKEAISAIQYEPDMGGAHNIVYLNTGEKVIIEFWKKQQKQFVQVMGQITPGISIDKAGTVPVPVINTGSGGADADFEDTVDYGDVNTESVKVIAQLEAYYYKTEKIFEYPTTGYWIITDNSMFFLENLTDSHPMKEIKTVDIHSILFHDDMNKLFLYDGSRVRVQVDKKDNKVLLAALEQAIPGLLQVKNTDCEYVPGISELDPRNPYGVRYDPEYPRGGYVVAYTKAFRKNMSSIYPAVDAAKAAGILPADWNPVTDAFDEDHPLAGVPMVYDDW